MKIFCFIGMLMSLVIMGTSLFMAFSGTKDNVLLYVIAGCATSTLFGNMFVIVRLMPKGKPGDYAPSSF